MSNSNTTKMIDQILAGQSPRLVIENTVVNPPELTPEEKKRYAQGFKHGAVAAGVLAVGSRYLHKKLFGKKQPKHDFDRRTQFLSGYEHEPQPMDRMRSTMNHYRSMDPTRVWPHQYIYNY